MTIMLWVWLLLVAGLLFMLLEVFIPSHGLLGVSGIACLALSLWFAFKLGAILGLVVAVLILILLPIEIVFGVKVFPRTPIGKRMILPAREDTTAADRASADDLSGFVGKAGVTVTMCRPSGIAEIDGKRVDVVAEGMVIDANRPINVLKIDGNRVIVREK